MIYFPSVCLTTAFVNLVLGGMAYFKHKTVLTMRFFLLCASVAIWSAGLGLEVISDSREIALFWSRFLHMGVIFIPITYLHFIVKALELDSQNRRLIIFIYLFSFVFSLANFSDLVVKDVSAKLSYNYYTDPGKLYPVLLLMFSIIIGYAIYLLFSSIKATTGNLKNQLRYIIIATLIGFGGGVMTFMPVFGVGGFNWGMYFVPIYPFVLYYAIVRYRLMDIRVAITRAGIFSVVYTFVLGIPFWLGYKYGLWYHSTWVMLILATLGPSIYMRLEKRSKELLYKTEFKRYETLRKFSKTLLLIKDLDKLLELIVYRLVKTLKVTFTGVYLYDKQNDGYLLKSYRPLNYPNVPKEALLAKSDPLIKALFLWKKELVRDEVKNLPLSKSVDANNHIELDAVKRRMQQVSATLIIPHFVDNDLLGFLVLGDKEKHAIYTEEDISILSSLSNSAALAIENSLFLIDLKATQAELFNAKRISELGYMASAMGHEINNRLQAIYTAAFDMVDNPAVSNSIENNPEAKEVFAKDIKYINENIEDATAIINELKTYARPQDKTKQDLHPVNLKEVIDKTLTVVRLQSGKAFDIIDFRINIPKTAPRVLGNFVQLQQVFVNMLNNAHDAILEKKNYIAAHPELNLNNYNGKIKVAIEKTKNMLNIHIIDDGIGMTEDIKKRLFIPLYTSKASADRKAKRGVKGGTGIGLYTLQTIIRRHNGSVLVHNTQRLKGTDFLITLPIAREKELEKEIVKT